MWSIYIGEIVHNFRSALDHIVWELAGRPPRTHKTPFPIFENEAGFNERGTNQFLKGVDGAVISLIKSEQPFFMRQDIPLHEHAGGLIQQDTILWEGILKGATNWPFEKGDIKAEFEVEIAFDEGTPAPGMWGVLGTLNQLANRAEHTLRRIAAEAFRSEL
jgi:hypothetical protein